jgi:hypothetical protein
MRGAGGALAAEGEHVAYSSSAQQAHQIACELSNISVRNAAAVVKLSAGVCCWSVPS